MPPFENRPNCSCRASCGQLWILSGRPPWPKVPALLSIGSRTKGRRDLRQGRDARQWTDGPHAVHRGRLRRGGAALRGAADGGRWCSRVRGGPLRCGTPPCCSSRRHCCGLPVRARQRQMARGAAPGTPPRGGSRPPASCPADRAARYVSARRRSIVTLGSGRSHRRRRSPRLRTRRGKPPPPALARVNEAPRCADPYYLYASSNAGSLAGLLAYPLLLEPFLSGSDQARLWAFGYAGFVGLALLCVITALSSRRLRPAGLRVAASRVESRRACRHVARPAFLGGVCGRPIGPAARCDPISDKPDRAVLTLVGPSASRCTSEPSSPLSRVARS